MAESIAKEFKSSILSSDEFYKSDKEFKTPTNLQFDFNKPESINENLLVSKVRDLLDEKNISLPQLAPERKFAEDGSWTVKLTRIDNKKELNASKIIIIEGVHALQIPELREMADLKIFTDTSDDFRLMLKIMRSPWYKTVEKKPIVDWRNFGNSNKEEKYEKFAEATMDAFSIWHKVKPSENKYVLPTKKWADLVIPGSSSWEEFEYGLDKVVNLINLYFQNKEEFKKKLKENQQELSPESKIKKLEEQLQKAERERERVSLWKQPSTYWLIASGAGLVCFAVLVYRLLLRKRKK